jgi:hypothetical protein
MTLFLMFSGFQEQRRWGGKHLIDKLFFRICLTLSYSSEGSPALVVFRHHQLKNCLVLLSVFWGVIGFEKT